MSEEPCIVAGIDVGGTTTKARAVDVRALVARADREARGDRVGQDEARVGQSEIGAGQPDDGAPVVPLGDSGDAIRCPTPTDDPEAALAAIADAVRTLAERIAPLPLRAVGVVVPGIIDEPSGIAVYQAQLGWDRLPVVERLGALTGLPTALGHDVRGGGLAEWRIGAGRGSDDLLFVMLGTGIGSAVVVDGRLLTADGYAGQLGHIQVGAGLRAGADPDGPGTGGPGTDELRCGCGQYGCLGTLASAKAVVRRYVARSGNQQVTEASEVAALARAGEQDAVRVWDDAVEALAAGLAHAITLFGSERIVLGGGLALAGDQLVAPVADRLRRRLTFHRRPTIRTAALGDESAILGAALLATLPGPK